MWVRGLKQPTEKIHVFRTMSHPMWVRGLKHVVVTEGEERCEVAPYVGAWIETWLLPWLESGLVVAPYVGAWIETCCSVT